MTATTLGRGNPRFGVVAVLVGLSILFLMTIPTIGTIELGAHAVERHQTGAEIARDWIANNASPGHRYDCPDGRTRVASPMPRGEWAVMVLESGVEVTSFVTADQSYVRKMLEPCKQWMRFAHP